MSPPAPRVVRFAVGAARYDRDEELNSEVFGLGESEDGTGQHLVFMRALTFDDQDRRLGQDTYCLVDEAQNTVYGGLRGWSVQRNVLKLFLEPAAADEFDADVFELELRASDVSVSEIVSRIESITGIHPTDEVV